MPTGSHQLPPPVRFLRLGWRAVRHAPSVLVVRALYEVFAYLVRLLVLFAVALALAAHFGMHVESGGGVLAWPAAALNSILGAPVTFLGLAGMLFTAWAFLFAVEALAYAGVWSGIRGSISGGGRSRWPAIIAGAFTDFPRAVAVRCLVRGTELTLVSMTVGTLLLIGAAARAVSLWSGSPLLVPSLSSATLLTFAASSAVVFRLTAEVAAAPVFLERVGIGEAMIRAARTVVSHPIYLYRLFVVSAAVLIPPLMLAWGAALLQNVVLSTGGGEGLAEILRFSAELAIVFGLAAFSVMLHATFFSYYAWENDLSEDEEHLKLASKVVSLTDLMPASYENIVDLDDVLGLSSTAPILDQLDAPPAAAQPQKAFDLAAILADGESDAGDVNPLDAPSVEEE